MLVSPLALSVPSSLTLTLQRVANDRPIFKNYVEQVFFVYTVKCKQGFFRLKSDGARDRAPGKPELSVPTGLGSHGDHRLCLVSRQKIFVCIHTSSYKLGINKENLFYFLENRSIVSQRAVPYLLRSSSRAGRFVALPGRCDNGILHKLAAVHEIFRSLWILIFEKSNPSSDHLN